MTAVVLAVCLAVTPLIEISESQVSAYLEELQAAYPSFAARVTAVARASKGTPYADGPLGEGPAGEYDQDPLMDLRRVDCVTFVEQTIALAAASSYQQAFTILQRIRYRDGKIDYESRNHFFGADWLENNRWCRDVSKDLPVSTAALARTISRRNFFQRVKAPALGQSTPDREVTIHYVPSSLSNQAIPHLPRPALIVFIGRHPDWLFALHTGLFLSDDTGTGRLYHASSKAGKVVATDLVEYLQQNTERYLGFTVYEITPPQ